MTENKRLLRALQVIGIIIILASSILFLQTQQIREDYSEQKQGLQQLQREYQALKNEVKNYKARVDKENITNTYTYNKTVVKTKDPYNYIQPSREVKPEEFRQYRDTIKIDGMYKCTWSTGNSMQPSIFTGYWTCWREVTDWKEQVDVGDVVSYDVPGASGLSVNHRVKAIYSDRVVTQGDNNRHDEHINGSWIEDVAVATIYGDADIPR